MKVENEVVSKRQDLYFPHPDIMLWISCAHHRLVICGNPVDGEDVVMQNEGTLVAALAPPTGGIENDTMMMIKGHCEVP